MRFSRRALSVLTVTLVLILLGGGVYWRLRPAAANGAQAQTVAGARAPSGDAAAQVSSVVSSAFSTDVPQPVSGAKVVRDTLWISVAAAGRAEAVSRATIQAQVGGVVEAVPVRENAAVGTGDLLLRVDSTEYALALARAQSDLRKARADYQQTVLFDDRITDARVKAQRDSIARSRSGLDAAEVAVKTARLQLDRSRVTSPFPGRIADVKVVAGQHVSAGAELMTVVDLDPI
jgi:multidrug resistance efflux pump